MPNSRFDSVPDDIEDDDESDDREMRCMVIAFFMEVVETTRSPPENHEVATSTFSSPQFSDYPASL